MPAFDFRTAAVLDFFLFIITGNILTPAIIYFKISSPIADKDPSELGIKALKNIKKAAFNKNMLLRPKISGDNRYFPY